jgi:glycosyltransferase involved in cell wall biosynthesis
MSGSPLNVCMVSPLPQPYGGIAHWTAMVTAYSAGRPDVELVVVNTAPRWRSIDNNGVLLRAVGGGLQLLRDVARLVRTLARRRFDAVHLTTSGHLAAVRDLAVSYVTAIFGVGLIYHIRFGRIPAIAEANALEWRLIRWVMNRAATVILIDQATFLAVQHFAPNARALLVPNCVNVAELPARTAAVAVVKTALFVGWVVSTKGVGELVEAWAKLRPQGWRLEIVGQGNADYQAGLLAQFGPENLIFVGELSHIEAMKRMANCDLFVLPSYTEGFPNVVAEAMALGRPIVATEVGAIPEMLAGDAGVLVKSKDSQALQEALNRVLLDSELREYIGQQAAAKAKSLYSIDVVFTAYMQIWRYK